MEVCLRLDKVNLPGLPEVVAYVDYASLQGPAGLTKLLMQKLGSPSHQTDDTALSNQDRDLARELIATCFRRAVFTRMDSEVDMNAMRRSILDGLGQVQWIAPRLATPSLQRAASELVTFLDSIDRLSASAKNSISCTLPGPLKASIDDNKREVIRVLLDVRRAAMLPVQLPFDLAYDHFFSAQDADQAPRAAA